jgi:hypothetical protein
VEELGLVWKGVVRELRLALYRKALMHRIRGTSRYANVVSTLCLVLLLGGGTAFATTQLLPKDSVGSRRSRTAQ